MGTALCVEDKRGANFLLREAAVIPPTNNASRSYKVSPGAPKKHWTACNVDIAKAGLFLAGLEKTWPDSTFPLFLAKSRSDCEH